MKSKTAFFATLVIAFLCAACTVRAQEITLRSELCMPVIMGNDDLLQATGIPIADDAFLHRRYRSAFQAYYQYFFCFNGNTEWINAGAEDSGAAALLRKALSRAYDGKYGSALRLAKDAFATDKRFGEASLIAGELEWILGDRDAAFSAWSVARNTIGYPAPAAGLSSALPLYQRSATHIEDALKRSVRKS